MNKNVLNKLSKIESKVELAEVKVDLALIDDINKASSTANKSINDFLSAYKIIDAQKDKAMSSGESYYKTAGQMETTLKQFEAKAKELGINPNDNAEYKSAQDLLVRYDIQSVFDRVDSLRKLK